MQDLVEEMLRDPVEYMRKWRKAKVKRFPNIKLDP